MVMWSQVVRQAHGVAEHDDWPFLALLDFERQLVPLRALPGEEQTLLLGEIHLFGARTRVGKNLVQFLETGDLGGFGGTRVLATGRFEGDLTDVVVLAFLVRSLGGRRRQRQS